MATGFANMIKDFEMGNYCCISLLRLMEQSTTNRCSLSQSPEVWRLETKVLAGLVPSMGWEAESAPSFSPRFWWFAGNQVSRDLEKHHPNHLLDLRTVFPLCSGCFASVPKVPLFIICHQSCCIRAYLNDLTLMTQWPDF